ncbi:MAG: helix-turn-helix domain-containing protein [candidate division WOR-3 bacterium]
MSLKEAVEIFRKKIERYLIENALKETNGDKKKTAKILKISRKTLYKKLKELKIE